MEELTTWQVIIISILIFIPYFAIVRMFFAIGDYFSSKADINKAKLRVEKTKKRHL